MSRSNPHDNGSQNPAVRWFEWNGELGSVRYYDKEAKKNVEVGSDFTFLLLDQLGSVRGWHEASQSGIYSNEVKDTRQDAMIVKAFKGGTLAEGIYKDIKDRVNALGGQFVANCYIAFKHEGEFAIGSLRFKGAALGAWMDFCKTHRADLYRQAIKIQGFTEGKKGRITYRMPVLKLAPLSEESHHVATALDVELQTFLDTYLRRNTRAQVESHPPPPSDDYDDYVPEHTPPPVTDDDIPF